MKTRIAIVLFIFLFQSHLWAETVSFEAAWNKISNDSAAVESSRLQTEALNESQSRASRHWLPQVYIDAKSYRSNDPGASFFGLLEQRSLKQSDFNPDTINHPDARVFTKGALGVDLPLYEGGMKSAQVDVVKYSAAAQASVTSQIQIEQYSQAGLAYSSIAILEQQIIKLQTLSSEINQMIKGYQLGSKSNPVGYSGLLGMKSLANRLSGLINQYESQSRAYYVTLNEMGLKNSSWVPEKIDSMAFVEKYFSTSANSDTPSSYKSDAIREGAKASEEMANMEKAKFLPRVGAFAESFVFSGDRETANGYNAGLYLQWNLYNPSDYGSLREAKLKAMSAAKNSEAGEQQERIERAAMVESIKSLKNNIGLLNDSDKLLGEQTKMTSTLFKNGSMNALQIVEILSRRTDLVVQQSEVHLGLVKAASQLVTKQKFDIAQRLSSGAKK